LADLPRFVDAVTAVLQHSGLLAAPTQRGLVAPVRLSEREPTTRACSCRDCGCWNVHERL
jgi:hypothetical protein